MTDTRGPEEPVSEDRAKLSETTVKKQQNPGATEPDEAADYKASFHPDTETRFATLNTGSAENKPGSAEKADESGTAPSRKQHKEKALSNQSSSSFPAVTAVIAILLAIVAAAGVVYLWNESRVEQARQAYAGNSLQADLAAQNARLEAMQANVANLGQQLEAAKAFAAEVKTNNQTLDGRVAAIEGEIAEMTGSNRIDWMLREVEHFVMVAERRLSLLADVDGALALMIEADQLVRDMAEPAARPLRNALQADLQALQQASAVSVDTEGLFSRLSLLAEKVPALRAASINYEMSLATEKETAAPPPDGLAYAWYEVKRFFSSLVRVQRVTDSEIKPLLLQDQQIFVEQNIRLLLEQAQLALLRGDQSVYRASLNEVGSRVREYLRTNTREAEAFLKSVAELKSATVEPEVPSIEGSVRAVQVFRDYWQKEKVERQLGTAAIENAVDSARAEAAETESAAADHNAATADKE